MYRILNCTIDSAFRLPELQETSGDRVDIKINLGDAAAFDGSGFQVTFEWIEPSGDLNCWVERRSDEYLFVIPGYARFYVAPNGVIDCYPDAGCSMCTLRHLLLNQVVPRVVAAQGNLVLHASAVTLADGRTFAFLGNSGFGKSTLASSYYRDGARLISDDCILLVPGSHGISAIGGMPGIRLFPDARQAVFANQPGFSDYTPYTKKQQLVFEQTATFLDPIPSAIDAVFILNDPGMPGSTDEIAIKSIGGASSMAALINCAFCLDPSDTEMIKKIFNDLGELVAGRLKFYSLSYPRDLSRLSAVKEAVSMISDGK